MRVAGCVGVLATGIVVVNFAGVTGERRRCVCVCRLGESVMCEPGGRGMNSHTPDRRWGAT